MKQIYQFLLLISSIFLEYAQSSPTKTVIIKSGGLSPHHIKQIIDVHNHYRSAVALGQISGQPMAQNMMELKWDDELAQEAQEWADQCKIAHDPNRHVGRFYVGQNLAVTWTTSRPVDYNSFEPDFTDQINKWFAEVKKYTMGASNSYSDNTGHYSQLVWSETSLVGCGYTFFFDPNRGYSKMYICNYGPSGNVIGSSPYAIGPPSCTNYGLLQSTKYSGLCDYNFKQRRFESNNLLG